VTLFISLTQTTPEITDKLKTLAHRWQEKRNCIRTIDPAYDAELKPRVVSATDLDELTDLLPFISDTLMGYADARRDHRHGISKNPRMAWRVKDAEMAAANVYWTALQQTVHALIKKQRIALTVSAMKDYELSEVEVRIVHMIRNEEYERAIIAIENLIGERDYVRTVRQKG
jgi:hypothetical protein